VLGRNVVRRDPVQDFTAVAHREVPLILLASTR
jgi:hypothetical protein